MVSIKTRAVGVSKRLYGLVADFEEFAGSIPRVVFSITFTVAAL